MSALKDVEGLPALPTDFVSPVRAPDMVDFLHFVFGFQVCIESFLFIYFIES